MSHPYCGEYYEAMAIDGNEHSCNEDCEIYCEGCDKVFCADNPDHDGQVQFYDNGWDKHYVCLKCTEKLDHDEKQYLRAVR